jgi:hypothetical protein
MAEIKDKKRQARDLEREKRLNECKKWTESTLLRFAPSKFQPTIDSETIVGIALTPAPQLPIWSVRESKGMPIGVLKGVVPKPIVLEHGVEFLGVWACEGTQVRLHNRSDGDGYDIRDAMGNSVKPHQYIAYEGCNTARELGTLAVTQAKAVKSALLKAADTFSTELVYWRCDTRLYEKDVALSLFKHNEDWFIRLLPEDWLEYGKWVHSENKSDQENHEIWLKKSDRYNLLHEYNALATWGYNGPSGMPIFDSVLKSGRENKPLAIDLVETLKKSDLTIKKTEASLEKIIQAEATLAEQPKEAKRQNKRKQTADLNKDTKKVKMDDKPKHKSLTESNKGEATATGSNPTVKGEGAQLGDSDEEDLPELPILEFAEDEPELPVDLEQYPAWCLERHIHWSKVKITKGMEACLEIRAASLDRNKFATWPKGLRHIHYQLRIDVDTTTYPWGEPWALLSLAISSDWKWSKPGKDLLARLEQAFFSDAALQSKPLKEWLPKKALKDLVNEGGNINIAL